MYSESTQAVRTHLYVREGRADDADMASGALAIGYTHEPAVAIGLHTTRRARSRRRPPTYPGGTPVRCEYRAPRQFARRVRSTCRAALRSASAVRSSRTGAVVRMYSESTQAVRTHLYVREGRADDADVADSAVGDTHEPAFTKKAIGCLHTTRRTNLAPAPTKGTRWHSDECRAPRRYTGRVLRVLAAHAVRHCAAQQRWGAAGRVPRCVGTTRRVLSSARAPLCL
jgi:hypothetical protein